MHSALETGAAAASRNTVKRATSWLRQRVSADYVKNSVPDAIANLNPPVMSWSSWPWRSGKTWSTVMRKLLLASVAALPLLGCVSTSDTGTSVTVPSVTVPVPGSAAEMINSIQGYAQTACGFLPAASFLTTLLGQSYSLEHAQEYAKAICEAVAPKPATFSTRRSARRHGSVNGVQVVGAYVR